MPVPVLLRLDVLIVLVVVVVLVLLELLELLVAGEMLTDRAVPQLLVAAKARPVVLGAGLGTVTLLEDDTVTLLEDELGGVCTRIK